MNGPVNIIRIESKVLTAIRYLYLYYCALEKNQNMKYVNFLLVYTKVLRKRLFKSGENPLKALL